MVVDRKVAGQEGTFSADSLVLGVTGHRADLLSTEDLPILRCTVRKILRAFAESALEPHTLVSSLAEGADQLVAEEALSAGYRLICPLPFPRALYERDFVREESLLTFRRLLDQAIEVTELPGERATPQADQTAYENAGAQMLDRVDVLLAIWNGGAARGAGGTAEIIASAERRGVPVVWIHASSPHSVRVLASNGNQKAAMESLLAAAISDC